MNNIFDQMASEDESRNPSFDSQLETDFESDAEVTFNDQHAEGSENENKVSRTSPEIKTVVQELLKNGYLEQSNRQELFRRVNIHQQSINDVLEPLDLALRVDTYRGVAFLTVAQPQSAMLTHEQTDSEDEDGWSHPLVRKQRLTLEQSLLVAILRQTFMMHEQESGVGQSAAKISVDELLPNFLTYFGDSGSDTKDENRLLQLLDQLKAHGIVSEVDKKHEITIRPLIAHFASPESLAALLGVLKENLLKPDDTVEGE